MLSEHPTDSSDILMRVRVIGGLLIQDGSEGGNMIIAVLNDDSMLKKIRDAYELPDELLKRLYYKFIT